jgi:hypothetical protein
MICRYAERMQGVDMTGLRRGLALAALLLAVALAVLAVPKELIITRWYFLHQDAQAGAALVVLYLIAMWLRPRWAMPRSMPDTRAILVAAVMLALLLWWGTHAVMFDYPLTRDEHMVEFDRAIFASGRLSAPLPAQWSGYAVALVPDFLLDVPGHVLLLSAYGPVNAGMRAGFGLLADPALLNPALFAVGLVLLHRIARTLFPDCIGAQWVALIGYALSAQVVVNAMTNYAMTAHLVFNLAWLALFLRNRWWSHALAITIGCAAIGLHQVIFHPLFAGPFLLLLLAQRRWGLFGFYAFAYAAAMGFWMSWPSLVAMAGGAPGSGSTAGGAGFLAERVVPLLLERDPRAVALMIYNLLRAIGWNAAFVLPFILLAVPAIRRREGVALPLAGGVILTIAAMTFLLPYQGHGWGYRYVHPVLGNCLLLAAYGYRELARVDRERAFGVATILALGTLPIMIWLLITTHNFVAPYARLTAFIGSQGSEFVIVDSERPGYAVDQVRNLPDLTNRPLVFSSEDLTQAQLRDLCARGTITLITRQEFHRAEFFVDLIPLENARFDQRLAPIRERDCLLPAQ